MKAALSLDLDNKWSYMKTHGDAAWTSFPSYLDLLVPRVLEILSSFGVRITFFIVGQDAAIDRNRDALAQIAASGHEIGNHSYHHEPWMSRRSAAEIDAELAQAEGDIERATGQRPYGFRGPGFVHSQTIVDVLVKRGYLYDASSLPTFIGPLARAYYFRSARLGAQERSERHDLFGNLSDGLRPNRPYALESQYGSLTEIPVTTMPGLRIPIHLSYVLYVASISPWLAAAYFRTALHLCRLTRTQPSILLHPLDFLTGRECRELRFFPAMSMDPGLKRDTALRTIQDLVDLFEVVPLYELLRTEEATGHTSYYRQYE